MNTAFNLLLFFLSFANKPIHCLIFFLFLIFSFVSSHLCEGAAEGLQLRQGYAHNVDASLLLLLLLSPLALLRR